MFSALSMVSNCTHRDQAFWDPPYETLAVLLVFKHISSVLAHVMLQFPSDSLCVKPC
ncbi:hypothetical protein ACRRTK_020407 [Alexandromys fortis]